MGFGNPYEDMPRTGCLLVGIVLSACITFGFGLGWLVFEVAPKLR